MAGLVTEWRCVAWGSKVVAPAGGFLVLLTAPPACVGAVTAMAGTYQGGSNQQSHLDAWCTSPTKGT